MSDSKINEWCAKEVGIEFVPVEDICWKLNGEEHTKLRLYEWNYLDPRCMAVIRGHFKINCSFGGKDNWNACQHVFGKAYEIQDVGNTPHEADCACLVKIWEASNE